MKTFSSCGHGLRNASSQVETRGSNSVFFKEYSSFKSRNSSSKIMFSSKQNLKQILERHFQLIYSVGLRDGFMFFCLLICIWHANRVLYPVLRGQPCPFVMNQERQVLSSLLNGCTRTRKSQFDERKRDWLVKNFVLRRLQRLDANQAEPPFLHLIQEGKGGFVCSVSLSVPAGVIYSHIPQVRVHSRTRISALLRRRY